ncbi:anthranilate synthase component I family protein [Persephonella sp.]
MEIQLFGQEWLGTGGLVTSNLPAGYFIFDNNRLILNGKRINTTRPFEILEKYIRKNRVYAAGFISYDYKKYIYPEKVSKRRDIGLPLIFLIFFKGFKRKKFKQTDDFADVRSLKFSTRKEEFINMVHAAKEYISAGDIYQINLSHRIEIDGFFNTDNIFQRLIQFQPTPYLMHIKTPYFTVISGSMELFLEKKDREIKSVPIKGTRRVGKTDEETARLKKELADSRKEQAENLMITDLMRNDIGRIASRGSVRVDSLFDIKQYTTVLQMESTVRGQLRDDVSLGEIIKATFPPGSVTGAPKKRAVEIIDLLEKHRREVYCGATVLMKPDGDFIMSVAIRQSIFKGNKCYIYVGSGIVADSDPEKEYEETLIKARANLHSLGLSQYMP